MSVIASCGHRLTEDEGLGRTLTVKSYNFSLGRTTSFVTYCDECYELAKKLDTILHTDQEEKEWLNGSKDN